MSLTMFSRAFRSAWLATVLLTTIVELTPFHSEGMPRYVFYSWKAFKCLLFLALGWETPLTFWKSNTLTNGLLLGFISAGAIECIQGLVVGHSFSPVELIAKMLIIVTGFLLGLIARHDESIGLASFSIHLVSTRKA